MAQLTTVTAERLLREVRIMLNQPRAENSRWSDEELLNYLNDGVSHYFKDINEFAEGQFDKTTTLDLVANTESVALPTDCFTIKVLYRKLPQETVPLVYRNNFIESYDSSQPTGAQGYIPYYYLRANNIVLRPLPGFNEVGGLVLEYTAFPDTLIFGGDQMTAGISPAFKELVVMYSVFKAKLKDDMVNGSNTSDKAGEHLAGLYKAFKHQVLERSKYPTFISPFIP